MGEVGRGVEREREGGRAEGKGCQIKKSQLSEVPKAGQKKTWLEREGEWERGRGRGM